METLHKLALLGNMRDLKNRAEYLITLGETYRPFAERLWDFADKFQEKAILNMVESFAARETDHE